MDKKVAKIIEVCGYINDPSWEMLWLLFRAISFNNLQRILERRDIIIRKLLKAKRKRVLCFKSKQPITDIRQLEDAVERTNIGLNFLKPVFFSTRVCLPFERIFIDECSPGVFVEAGAILKDVTIDGPTYIDRRALVEYTKIQAPERCNYIGVDVTISNVFEMRGCFISGGKFSPSYKGRTKTYMHPASMNNMIVGAGAGISGGTNVHNHPQAGASSAVFDLTRKKPRTHRYPPDKKYFKMPIFIGVGSGVGLNCSIHSGSIIGAHALVPGNTIIKGYAMVKNGRTEFGKFSR